MAQSRHAQTTKIGGGADYAKVAERLKIFREECPRGKHESAFEADVDQTTVFTVWLWKDKTDLLDLMKSGITDKEVLRSSADANGNAKGAIGGKEKDFEKLESIALGRALANLGYLASGEIASSEEMEEFEKFRDAQQQQAIDEAIVSINTATDLEHLRKLFMGLGQLGANPDVFAAKEAKKAALTAKETTDENS